MTQGVGGLSLIMENKSDFNYISPEIYVIEVETEGSLCVSNGENEGVGNNFGTW